MGSIALQIALAVKDVVLPYIKPLFALASVAFARWSGKREGRAEATQQGQEASRERTITRLERRARIENDIRRAPPVSRIERVRNSRWIARP